MRCLSLWYAYVRHFAPSILDVHQRLGLHLCCCLIQIYVLGSDLRWIQYWTDDCLLMYSQQTTVPCCLPATAPNSIPLKPHSGVLPQLMFLVHSAALCDARAAVVALVCGKHLWWPKKVKSRSNQVRWMRRKAGRWSNEHKPRLLRDYIANTGNWNFAKNFSSNEWHCAFCWHEGRQLTVWS